MDLEDTRPGARPPLNAPQNQGEEGGEPTPPPPRAPAAQQVPRAAFFGKAAAGFPFNLLPPRGEREQPARGSSSPSGTGKGRSGGCLGIAVESGPPALPTAPLKSPPVRFYHPFSWRGASADFPLVRAVAFPSLRRPDPKGGSGQQTAR